MHTPSKAYPVVSYGVLVSVARFYQYYKNPYKVNYSLLQRQAVF